MTLSLNYLLKFSFISFFFLQTAFFLLDSLKGKLIILFNTTKIIYTSGDLFISLIDKNLAAMPLTADFLNQCFYSSDYRYSMTQ